MRQYAGDPHAADALLEQVRACGADAESWRDFLAGVQEYRRAARNPSGFRPSVKSGRSLVGILLRIDGKILLDNVVKIAKALARALKLESTSGFQAPSVFMAMLFRPTSSIRDSAAESARSIIVTVHSAAQFVTVAAHVGAYPRFPVVLLQSASYDIRRSLQSISAALSGLR